MGLGHAQCIKGGSCPDMTPDRLDLINSTQNEVQVVQNKERKYINIRVARVC